MAANPRKVELVCLKKRSGQSEFNCYFDYYTNIDKFVSRYKSSDDLSWPDYYDENDAGGSGEIRYYLIEGNFEEG